MSNKKYILTITNLTKEEAKKLSEHFTFGSIYWTKIKEDLIGYLGDSEISIVEQLIAAPIKKQDGEG